MKISLHLGAHKTATTYLQTALEQNAPMLAHHGVMAVPLEQMRTEVTRRVWRRPDWDAARQEQSDQRAAAFLSPLLAQDGVTRLILSDENLIGTPGQIVLEGQLYPDIAARLGALPRLLEAHEVEVFLAVRPLAGFTRSVYCESLRAPLPRFTEPDDFRAAWQGERRGWDTVIGQISALFPASRITLWSHDLVRTGAGAVLNTLAGMPDDTRYDLAQIYRRRSLSQRATEALLDVGRQHGTRAMADAATAMGRDHPLGPGNRQYMLWPRQMMRKDRLAWPETYGALADAAPQVRLLPLPDNAP